MTFTEKTFSEDDMNLARLVHRTLLPQRLVSDWVDIDTRYREMHLLGGDYATVYERETGRIFLCICDVTGHGLTAALLAGRVNSFVRHAVSEIAHPCQVVDGLNTFFSEKFSDFGVFVTFFCVELNLACREIRYAGCGHPPAVLSRWGETMLSAEIGAQNHRHTAGVPARLSNQQRQFLSGRSTDSLHRWRD